MSAWMFLLALVIVFALAWSYFSRRPGKKAKLGPDGTNVREPETFVVHHEGKGQGLDIANTSLKERTETMSRDLPGDAHKVKTPVPGRDRVAMSEPPSDISKYGGEKVAPGATPGQRGAESKDKVLTEGPIGSRPGTPEEPGSPYAKGRRVTDVHRPVDISARTLPATFPGDDRQVDRTQAVSPSTNGQEPGYGLGRTGPGRTDGEGGYGPDDDDGPDSDSQQRVRFTSETDSDGAFTFEPDPAWLTEVGDEFGWPDEAGNVTDWSALRDMPMLPDNYGEDVVVALVRNPRSLYVYWEHGGYGKENLRHLLGEEEYRRCTPCLRIYDLSTGAYPGQAGGESWTVAVSRHDDHWFVNDRIEPGHRYIVSYEERTPDGRHYLLSHSGPIQTPPDGPTAETAANELYRLYGGQGGSGGATSPWR